MAVAGGSSRTSSGWCGGAGGRKNYLSSGSCLHGEGSVSSLARWSERQALWSGEWKPEARRYQEDTVRPWPRLSQGHSLLSPCPDSGTQPGGVPSAPTGPLGPPGHGQTLGKSEGIRAG